jgi:hypothetical protein
MIYRVWRNISNHQQKDINSFTGIDIDPSIPHRLENAATECIVSMKFVAQLRYFIFLTVLLLVGCATSYHSRDFAARFESYAIPGFIEKDFPDAYNHFTANHRKDLIYGQFQGQPSRQGSI